VKQEIKNFGTSRHIYSAISEAGTTFSLIFSGPRGQGFPTLFKAGDRIFPAEFFPVVIYFGNN
jgi:hypothetical protein